MGAGFFLKRLPFNKQMDAIISKEEFLPLLAYRSVTQKQRLRPNDIRPITIYLLFIFKRNICKLLPSRSIDLVRETLKCNTKI